MRAIKPKTAMALPKRRSLDFGAVLVAVKTELGLELVGRGPGQQQAGVCEVISAVFRARGVALLPSIALGMIDRKAG